jgi:hypothetical protein
LKTCDISLKPSAVVSSTIHRLRELFHEIWLVWTDNKDGLSLRGHSPATFSIMSP